MIRRIIKSIFKWRMVRIFFEHLTNLYQISRLDLELEILGEDIAYQKLLRDSPLNIQGGMSHRDSKAIKMLLTKYLIDKPMVVEVGSWDGGSALVIAKEVKKRNGVLFCVDHWQGSEGELNRETASRFNIFSRFQYNMEKFGVWNSIRTIMSDSQTASMLVANNILNMVYIDGAHSYKEVERDIMLWLPKLKQYGVICGHDYNSPGVRDAVNKLFGDKVSTISDSLLWYSVIE